MIQDPPSPVTIFRGIIGAALAVAVAALVAVLAYRGEIEWKLVALIAALATLWRAGSELYDRFIEPAARFFWQSLSGGRSITLEDEIADLERRLKDRDTPPESEIFAAVRLAEIYRRYRSDLQRSCDLLDRLLVKYPDSRALRRARGLEV